MPLPDFNAWDPNGSSLQVVNLTSEYNARTRMISVLLEKAAKLDTHPGADTAKELADIQVALRQLQAEMDALRQSGEKLDRVGEAINRFILAP